MFIFTEAHCDRHYLIFNLLFVFWSWSICFTWKNSPYTSGKLFCSKSNLLICNYFLECIILFFQCLKIFGSGRIYCHVLIFLLAYYLNKWVVCLTLLYNLINKIIFIISYMICLTNFWILYGDFALWVLASIHIFWFGQIIHWFCSWFINKSTIFWIL